MQRSAQDTEHLNGVLLGIGMAIDHLSEIDALTAEQKLTIAESLRDCFYQLEKLWESP